MTSAREEILRRAKASLDDAPVFEVVAAPPRCSASGDGLPDRFAERVADYKAGVTRCLPTDVASVVAAVLAEHGASAVVRPGDGTSVGPERLATIDGVVTGCRLAIAETGTIVLDGGSESGPRILTLLPDLHVCVVRASQVVADVSDAIDGLAGCSRPVTFISGPSATSDIELERVEGVHGPRRLHVVLVA